MMGPGTRTGTLGAAGCDAARRHGGGANGDSSAALSAATSASGCTSFFDYPRKWVGTAARFPEGFTLATHNVQAAGTRGGGVRRSERAPLEKCLRDLVEGEYSVLCLQEMQRCKRCESKPAAVLPVLARQQLGASPYHAHLVVALYSSRDRCDTQGWKWIPAA